jgi:integrase
MRPMGKSALDELSRFKPRNVAATDYVFPGNGKQGHFVGFAWAWARIAEKAGIEEITAHGLRHWFASAGAEMNYSDFVIGGLLGHAKRGMTGRCANAPDAALILAADRISQHLADALDGKAAGKVVQLTA